MRSFHSLTTRYSLSASSCFVEIMTTRYWLLGRTHQAENASREMLALLQIRGCMNMSLMKGFYSPYTPPESPRTGHIRPRSDG
jgi:hypothetical protein